MQKQRHTVEVLNPDLDVKEHLPLLERGWIIQKIGWLFLISIMIAGAIGAFGDGLLSKKTVTIGNVTAEFERFYRYEAEMEVLVTSSDHISCISFPQEYLKSFRILHFVPEPLNNNTLNGEVRFNFLPSDNRQVSIYLVTKTYGKISGTMKVNQTGIPLHHYIYP